MLPDPYEVSLEMIPDIRGEIAGDELGGTGVDGGKPSLKLKHKDFRIKVMRIS